MFSIALYIVFNLHFTTIKRKEILSMINVSTKIKQERLKKKFSQEELAEKLFVSRQTISNWENERSFPNYDNLILLSKIFNIPINHFYEETPPTDSLKNQTQYLSNKRLRGNSDIGMWRTGIFVFLIISIFIPYSAPISFCILFLWKEKITPRLFLFAYRFLLTVVTIEVLVAIVVLAYFLYF
ncbi:helix-turn-helix transcriptional regulator [Enterococcus faecium]|uniref:helix-turn-helix domain-containing protein n=1 Tax=Enterococcus faecium TaxID=1352 RepID=UPI003132BC80